MVKGPGGLSRLLPIAIPMVISQLFDTTMTFIDRLFLSYVSPLAMAACMTGGITAFLCANIIFGLVSYSATLVAHRYGAAKHKECPLVIMQALWLALASYPFVLIVGFFVAGIFNHVGHTPEQIALELSYYRIMIFATILGLLRAAFCGFFAGIGKTRVIMIGNTAALVTNVIGNYVLIFGKCGFPALGIVGAALGTALATGVMMIVMGFAFWIHVRQSPYRGMPLFRIDWSILRQLIRYGFPSGFEGFSGLLGFGIVIMMLHSISEEVASAVTMVYNWELFSFFPMLGVQIAVAALVGQNIGARNIKGARQSVRSGLTLVMGYTAILIFFFVAIPHLLLTPFTQKASPEIIELAVPMMRLMALYIALDGASLVISGALRGAGDSFWAMMIGLMFHIIMVVVCAITIYGTKSAPLTVWFFLCASICMGTVMYGIRYRLGHWQKINLSVA